MELPDGDFIDLAWSGPIEGKTVLLLHGLEGNINSDYIGRLVHELNLRGYRACIMHFRGCSHEPNRLPEWYHSGKSDDPHLIVEILRKEMGNQIGSPNHQIFLSWLSLKESKFCEDRELKILCWARHAAYGAYAAAIIADISIVITIGIHLFTKAP